MMLYSEVICAQQLSRWSQLWGRGLPSSWSCTLYYKGSNYNWIYLNLTSNSGLCCFSFCHTGGVVNSAIRKVLMTTRVWLRLQHLNVTITRWPLTPCYYTYCCIYNWHGKQILQIKTNFCAQNIKLYNLFYQYVFTKLKTNLCWKC